MPSRFAWQNYAQLAGAALSASGSQGSRPVRWARDPIRGKTWRSPVGWVIVAGWNDKIDLVEGVTGAAVATLTPGTYATGAALAAEIETQLNAAATDNTYTCTYDPVTEKLTIARATGVATISLPWLTGTNAATSATKDLGYTADDSGLTSYVGDNAVKCGRAWIGVDLGSALEARRAAVVHSNLQSSGVLTARGSSTSVLAALTAPTTSQTLTGDSELRIADFAGQTLRYWAFLFDDTSNPDAFLEAGVVYVGSYLEVSREYRFGRRDGRAELTSVRQSDHGAQYRDEKPTQRLPVLNYDSLTEADKVSLDTMGDHLRLGRAFLYTRSSSDVAGTTRYVYFDAPLDFQRQDHATTLWQTVVALREAV